MCPLSEQQAGALETSQDGCWCSGLVSVWTVGQGVHRVCALSVPRWAFCVLVSDAWHSMVSLLSDVTSCVHVLSQPWIWSFLGGAFWEWCWRRRAELVASGPLHVEPGEWVFLERKKS